jgi:hypothetical protein
MAEKCDTGEHNWRLYNGAIGNSWADRRQDYYRCTKCGKKQDNIE